MNTEDFTIANDENMDLIVDNSFLLDNTRPALLIQNTATNLAAVTPSLEEQSILSKSSMDVLV